MKEIKAIIQEFMLPRVIEALQTHPEFPGLTVSRVRGFGKCETGQDLAETPPKMELEIVVPASLADSVVEIIRSSAHTGRPGDGKIFVSTIDAVIKVRTGERDREAL